MIQGRAGHWLEVVPLLAALASGQAIFEVDPDLLSGRLFVTTGTGLVLIVPLTPELEVLALESIPTIVPGLFPFAD